MFYILLIAYLLVGVFFAVLTTVVLDDEVDDVLFGLVLVFWPIAIVLAALCGLTYAIIWSARKLGIWIRNTFMGDDVEFTNLYFIENDGCNDTTHGLVELTDKEADVIVEMFKNLNKNSYYGCMPEIHMYRIPEKLVSRPDGNEEREELLYTNTGEYVLIDNIFIRDYSTTPATITFKEGVEQLV